MSLDTSTSLIAYSGYVSYIWDYGVEGSAVAGPAGTPCEIIDIHAPICMKVISWVTQSYDAPPRAPDPNTQSSNERLRAKVIGVPFALEMPDGTIVRTRAGRYYYLLRVPPSDTDPLVIGTPPFDLALFETILPSDFMTGLTGPSGTPTGQGQYGGV